MSSGILVKSIFDSRLVRPQIAIGRDPKHLDIFTVPAGTALVANAGNSWFASETLFEIKHNLLYTPKVMAYFYTASDDRYGVGKYLYATGASDDYITYQVNDTYFRIIHAIDGFGGPGTFTSTAPAKGNVRIKYLIFSNPIGALTGV